MEIDLPIAQIDANGTDKAWQKAGTKGKQDFQVGLSFFMGLWKFLLSKLRGFPNPGATDWPIISPNFQGWFCWGELTATIILDCFFLLQVCIEEAEHLKLLGPKTGTCRVNYGLSLQKLLDPLTI